MKNPQPVLPYWPLRIFFSTKKYWLKKFVDSYSENSWKHVVNSIIEEEEEGDEEKDEGDLLLTADEIEKMGK